MVVQNIFRKEVIKNVEKHYVYFGNNNNNNKVKGVNKMENVNNINNNNNNNNKVKGVNEMEKYLSIKEICDKYGFSEVYIRRAILKGKLNSKKVEIAKNTYKHLISEADFEKWRKATKGGGNRREDRRNKYNIYCNSEEIALLEQLLKNNDLQTPIKRSNEKKIKQI